MTNFDFDEVIERRGSHSGKWDGMVKRFGVADPSAIALSVAEMDFRAPPAVNAALVWMAEHGIHGYFADDAAMKAAVTNWLTTRHGWTPEADWIGTVHGIVSGLGLCIQAFTDSDDEVAVFSPVYHMFAHTVNATGRGLVECELDVVQGRHEIDFDRMAAELGPKVRMILLCSPHNPGGRVWSAEELRKLGDFCVERDIVLVSDEIHHDLVFDGATHHVTAKAAPDVMDLLVTLIAPSKTFNIAGGQVGYSIISNPEMRRKLARVAAASGTSGPNRTGAIMATAAYAEGAEWLDALLPYLQENRDLFHRAVAERLPGVSAMHAESTYLSWLDFRGTGLTEAEIAQKMYHEALLVPHKGSTFGKGGDGWWRFNIACPRATLDTLIERLAEVFGRV